MKLWGGRFRGQLDPAVWALNASLPFDKRLARQDVRASIAWARALGYAGILTTQEEKQIQHGLEAIFNEFEKGEFVFQETDEDIHTAVERRLGELIGETAGKLHSGRSRNDQVVTDFRLWIMDHLPRLDAALLDFQTALIERSETDMGIILPGYTHMQRAQPILLSHWWLSHFWPIQRDRSRLLVLNRHISVLPLGSGALAGTPFPIDRKILSAKLGFHEASQNSIDAVSDRDFAAEFLFNSALAGVHLSKLAEAIVLFSSSEFGFIELSDAYATGSSLMPQKKNPDPFELARGKSGVLIGGLIGLLTTLKGLPSTYDKDLQEDKVPVFNAYDTLMNMLPALAGALRTLTPHPERMRAAIDTTMMATDLADYLVWKGVPFREAHSLTGNVVRMASDLKKELDTLTLDEYQSISPLFAEDVFNVFNPDRSVSLRGAFGGTAPQAVAEQIRLARLEIED